MSHNTDWMYKKKWGIFVHYLNQLQNNPKSITNDGAGETSWDDCINSVDVELIADQLEEIGAGYFCITIMQQQRYMIAPNARFNELTGYKDGEACSTRDLISDLYEALNKRGIDLMLYFTGDGPAHDKKADEALDGYELNGKRILKPFVEKWASVLEWYSVKYGDKIKGWWLDGTYTGIGYEDQSLIKIIADAARKGNPNTSFSANFYGCLTDGREEDGIIYGGFYKDVLPGLSVDDYTAGELVKFSAYPESRFIDGVQWQILSFLGAPADPRMVYDGWAKPSSQYTPEFMHDYVRDVNAKGGVVTIDVCMHRNGRIDEEQMQVLRAIKQ